MTKKNKKPDKLVKRKKQSQKTQLLRMIKWSVSLPSASVLGLIEKSAVRTGRKKGYMAGWLLEAAYLAVFNKPDRRLVPKKSRKLIFKSEQTYVGLGPKIKKPLTRFIYDFCTKEHLEVGIVVEDMLLVALEAFETMPWYATCEQLTTKIRKQYLK